MAILFTKLIYRRRNIDTGEVMASLPNLNRTEIDKTINKFEKKNGNRLKNFSLKEIVLMFHKDTKGDIQKINNKMDKHIEQSEERMAIGTKYMSDHDMLIQRVTDNLNHIVKEMPEKGFCEKINKTLYDETGKDKVELMWHDRRWIKALIGVVLAMGGIQIIIQFA